MKLAIISLGGKSSLNILAEAKKYFTKTDHINLKKINVQGTTKELIVNYKDKPLQDYDCVYLRGSFRYALLQRAISMALQDKTYLPLQPESFTLGHDKLLTLLALQKNKVPIPTTYLAATTKTAKKVLEIVNYPIILKIPSGTQGKGVMFADSLESAKTFLDTLDVFNQTYIIQEYIETDATDIRAIVAGKKVIAAMRRKGAAREIRSNIHMGGVGEPYELSYDVEQMAIHSAKAINADLCAVDILESGNKAAVIEVNLSPGLKGITEATNKNVAAKIAKFLAKQAENREVGEKSTNYNNIMKDLDASKLRDQEIITTLNIKAGIIKLPGIVTKITGFTTDDEISMMLNRGSLELKKHEIEKGEVKKKRRRDENS